MNEPTQIGFILRDCGVEAVLAADTAPHRGAGEVIASIIEDLADEGRDFTADDVRGRMPIGCKEHSPNVLPACFSRLRRAGRIKTVGFTVSKRGSRHSGAIRVWRGVDSETEAVAA